MLEFFREHVEDMEKSRLGFRGSFADVVIIQRQSSQVEKVLSRIPTVSNSGCQSGDSAALSNLV